MHNAANLDFINKLAQLHDHKGTLSVFWHVEPSEAEKEYLARAWNSKIGDGSRQVEHLLKTPDQSI